MTKDTSNKPSIFKQVARGLLIGLAIGMAVMAALSALGSSRSGHGQASARTRNDISALIRAIESFQDEYQKLPDVSSLDFETEGPQAVNLITILLGKEETPEPEMQNRRQIAFLTTRLTRNRKQGGLVYSSANEIVGMHDGWGNPLRVIFRPPGKTEITISHLGKQVFVKDSVAVLSRGPDQKWGTKDDLMSPNEFR